MEIVHKSSIKVLYDISVLGLGQAYSNARTGVYRVIENLATELTKTDDCDLVFCNSQLDVLSLTHDYFQNNPNFSHLPFSLTSQSNKIQKLDIRRNSIKEKIQSSSATTSNYFLNRLESRRLGLQRRLLLFYYKERILINPADLEAAKIFHSPFYAVPKEIYTKGEINIFLNCYDLIPILYPQFAQPNTIKLIKDFINTITPDTWVLCISEATRNDLLNYLGNRVDAAKVLVTELAASNIFYRNEENSKNYQVRSKYNIPDSPYILSVCTLEPRKNIDQAIRAFVRLVQQEKIPDLTLVLVGGKGWMFDKIFEEIEAIAAIKNRIIITGYVADEDLASLYTDALFFVYPSFYEGFGLPPLEAMQCGTPVITSNTSSLPEVVGDAGLMVAPTDLDALSEAMLSLYKNPSLRQELSEKSLQRAKRFSWERCAQETVNAYKASLI